MANAPTFSIFDYKTPLPDASIAEYAKKLLGFDKRYKRIHNQLQLLLRLDELPKWSTDHHGVVLPICSQIAGQYPLAIFHGDVGTGKTTTAECIANRIVTEANVEGSMLFKLSNRVRGSGKVGEMGTLLADAFNNLSEYVGNKRRAILIIDEGDSLAATRTQEQSHHEDKVAVNTLIQSIDNLRKFGGRILTILCTNRLSIVDAALQRRATIVEEFTRPTDRERAQLLTQDLVGVTLTKEQLVELVRLTGPLNGAPTWTFSDITTRLYPAALGRAFPSRPLSFDDLKYAALAITPAPIMES
jgi:SpoVK/Ycf46/Vps4 family AAA+-type ATPase